MRLLLSLVLFLSLSYDSLAAPTALPPQQRSRSFRVERVKRSDYIPNGPNALAKAYRKFGLAPTTFIDVDLNDFEAYNTAKSAVSTTTGSSEDDQTGEVAAKSINSDVEFISTVTIGGQGIPMDFDTGSADMWVLNSNMNSSYTSGHTVYDPSKSTTYKAVTNSSFEISYGDNSWAKGTVCRDTVSIGGATITNQAIGLPSTVSASFVSDTNSNGLLGLGFSSMNTFKPGPQKTFFDNIAPNLEEPVFTSLLRSDGVGEYEFGKIDSSKYTGSLVNVSVDSSNGYWQFESAFFGVGGGSLQTLTGSVTTAIADTGTSLMLVPTQMLEAYYGSVTNAQHSSSVGGYVFPCNQDLPNLTIALGDKYQATIPGSFINFDEIGTNTTTGEKVCYGGVQSSSGSSMMIFGDVFLKALFVVFDQRGPSIAFASPA
ncbi:aspergillopepsin A-like aspartic endopeptidase [Penicillium maclennaniae]|uniref:aspergillopepsin A-like aspartic endopeptidase n=1 Tax=Penicillium maclennaniae TaxID=1343394 RepID=UPI00254019D2|nr:aspergillopepsin A-like aspartic endopeptidase [Penicillium maclennaniae]KAJ5670410.1 aspergillopepsin A-like aspartic endopeptidase [Penicillium maclennaniae]